MSAQPVDVLATPRRCVPIHKAKVLKRGAGIVTTTLCGRSRVLADGMNITPSDQRVSCKLCRAALARVQGGQS